MPVNNSPDLRIRELDRLLSKKHHSPEGCNIAEYQGCWTKDELAKTVSENLDLGKIISTKTIENDIDKMEKHYGAPIDKKNIFLPSYNTSESRKGKNVKKVGIFYWDRSRNIFNNNNLSKEEYNSLRSVIDILKQFKGLNNFEDVGSLIEKLEIKAVKSKSPSIFFETVDNYSGLEHVSILAHAIKKELVVSIQYQAFNEEESTTYTIHPYQLKEYKNRWFVLAYTEEFNERALGVYGLSRITQEPDYLHKNYKKPELKRIKKYFKDIIGVTNYENEPIEQIIFKATGNRRFYVKTKPWHSSQNIIEESTNSTLFSIHVKQNNELIAHILSFGKDVQIIEPPQLRDKIKALLSQAIKGYN